MKRTNEQKRKDYRKAMGIIAAVGCITIYPTIRISGWLGLFIVADVLAIGLIYILYRKIGK